MKLNFWQWLGVALLVIGGGLYVYRTYFITPVGLPVGPTPAPAVQPATPAAPPTSQPAAATQPAATQPA